MKKNVLSKYKSKKAFTLIEILVSILILSIVLITAFELYTKALVSKVRIDEQAVLEKNIYYFSERLFQLVKKGGTLDYEEYWNRKMVGIEMRDDGKYGHYANFTGFGNYGGKNGGATSNFSTYNKKVSDTCVPVSPIQSQNQTSGNQTQTSGTAPVSDQAPVGNPSSGQNTVSQPQPFQQSDRNMTPINPTSIRTNQETPSNRNPNGWSFTRNDNNVPSRQTSTPPAPAPIPTPSQSTNSRRLPKLDCVRSEGLGYDNSYFYTLTDSQLITMERNCKAGRIVDREIRKKEIREKEKRKGSEIRVKDENINKKINRGKDLIGKVYDFNMKNRIFKPKNQNPLNLETNYGSGFYYCLSGKLESQQYRPTKERGCNPSQQKQRYGQYFFQFIDYNSDANNDGGDSNGDCNIIRDDDDKYLGKGPEVFDQNSDVKELYLLSGDKKTRTFIRWNYFQDEFAGEKDFGKCSENKQFCRGTIEFLKLEGKDWGLDHKKGENDNFEGDGVIDTWVIASNFPQGGEIPKDNIDNYWKPLFSDSINISDFKVFAYPNIDSSKVWEIDSDQAKKYKVSPYVILSVELQPSWKVKTKIRAGEIKPIRFNTTINLTEIFSN